MLDHKKKLLNIQFFHLQKSGQISIIPKPELTGFGGDSLSKPPLKVSDLG